MSSTCVKSDLRRIWLPVLRTKSANALSPTTFAFNRCPCALRLVVKHTRGYCFVLHGFIRLLSSQAISDFTSAASLFTILKISMLRIGFFWIYQVPRLLKRILRYSATVKIILANCSYFKAKDFGTPYVPCPSVSLHGWSTGTLPKRVLVTDLDLKSTKLQTIIGFRMGLLDLGHLR